MESTPEFFEEPHHLLQLHQKKVKFEELEGLWDMLCHFFLGGGGVVWCGLSSPFEGIPLFLISRNSRTLEYVTCVCVCVCPFGRLQVLHFAM